MNQRSVIYIILSAILLYLYYKRGGIAIFAAFVVVVAGTLIIGKDIDSVEGMKGGSGGGECAKVGFTPPKIAKDENGNVGESLEKEMKKIKKIADKYWPYDERGNSNDETEKTSMEEYVKIYAKIMKKNSFSKEEDQAVNMFLELNKDFYYKINNQDQSKRKKIELKVSDLPKGYIKNFIPTKFSEVLENVSKSGELKDEGAKKLAKYLNCLCKHWIAIYTKIDSMATGKKIDSSKNEGKETDDEEEKPKKKKKKATKKKKSEDDDDEDAVEEDE